eukprot:TRINITY_DN2902_c0_g1_i1.p1 TRINITY_DN2902_c0_g1~~TRINITY_DN2902_c0_g1_i1.p1  ORF type:complete len:428 (-),score=107.56 TRINITY_DN2902_c0_g1_i1:58-1194(-)
MKNDRLLSDMMKINNNNKRFTRFLSSTSSNSHIPRPSTPNSPPNPPPNPPPTPQSNNPEESQATPLSSDDTNQNLNSNRYKSSLNITANLPPNMIPPLEDGGEPLSTPPPVPPSPPPKRRITFDDEIDCKKMPIGSKKYKLLKFVLIFGMCAAVVYFIVEILSDPPEVLEQYLSKVDFDPPAPFLPEPKTKPYTLIIDADVLFSREENTVRSSAKEFVKELLQTNLYEVILWDTASSAIGQKHSDHILAKFFQDNEDALVLPLEIFNYRQNSYEKGKITRRLNLVGRELTNIVVLSKNPELYSTRDNTIELPESYDDESLVDLVEFLKGLAWRYPQDMRREMRRYSRMAPHEFIETIRKKRKTLEQSPWTRIKKSFFG